MIKIVLFLFIIFGMGAHAVESSKPNAHLHMLWVNESKEDSILPQGRLQTLVNWSNQYPMKGSPSITFWYDSNFVTNDALQKTTEEIQKLCTINQHSENVLNNILFKKVQDLETVQKYPVVFNDNTNIYFRVDLLRLAVLYSAVEKQGEQKTYHFYTDIDNNLQPISIDALLSNETLTKLKTYGTVMAEPLSKALDFENYAQILGSDNPNLLKALKMTIDVNIARALFMIIDLTNQFGSSYTSKNTSIQTVYDSIKPMFELCKILDGKGKLTYSYTAGAEDFNFDNVKQDVSKVINTFLPVVQNNNPIDQNSALNTFRPIRKWFGIKAAYERNTGQPLAQYEQTASMPTYTKKKTDFQNINEYKADKEKFKAENIPPLVPTAPLGKKKSKLGF